MKPVRVGPGECSEYETLLKRAADLEKAIDVGDHDVKFEDVSGSNVRAQHYWTNQEIPDDPETVTKKIIQDNNPPGLNYHANANPHQSGSTLGMHVTDGGGDRPAAIRQSELFGAWKEDNPFDLNAIVNQVEELARHL